MSELEKELLDVLAAIGEMYKEDDDISTEYILHDPPAAPDAPSIEVDKDDPSRMASAGGNILYFTCIYIHTLTRVQVQPRKHHLMFEGVCVAYASAAAASNLVTFACVTIIY